MIPVDQMDSLEPTDLRALLRARADQLHVHGDFAPGAVAGARHIRTRRAVTATAAAALAIALPFGLASLDRGADRGNPATRTVRMEPAPTPVAAVARVGAPEGPMPLPYIQAGLLHLNGRTIPLPSGAADRLEVFRTLSNGGVVYQSAGPSETARAAGAGPATFLDRDGRVVNTYELSETDTDTAGDVVTGIASNGDHVALDVDGRLIRRFSSSTSYGGDLGPQLGDDLVASLPAQGQPLWVGSLSTGRSSALLTSDIVAIHDGRSLLLQRAMTLVQNETTSSPSDPLCRRQSLVNYLSGESLRSWCGDELSIGFSPTGDWMYGWDFDSMSIWVDRTDDGAKLLHIDADSTRGDSLFPESPVPSPDGTALLMVVQDQKGDFAIMSCSIANGQCTVVSDGLGAPRGGRITLPDNWGAQETIS